MKTKSTQFNPLLTRKHFKTSFLQPYLVYIKKFYPEINPSEIINKIGLSLEYVNNKNNWVSLTFEKIFTKAIENQIHESFLHRKVGAYGVQEKVLGKPTYFLINNFSLLFNFNHISKLINSFNKTIQMSCLKYNSKEVVFLIKPNLSNLTPDERTILSERLPSYVNNIIGYLSMVPAFKVTPGDHFQISCLEKDSYTISISYFDRDKLNPTKKATNFAFLFILPYFLFFIITNQHILALKSAIGISIFLYLLTSIKSRFWLKKKYEDLLMGLQIIDDQITETDKINQNLQHQFFQNMNLINITKNISISNSEKSLLDTTCQILSKTSPSKRLAAFLLNEDKSQISYISSYGFDKRTEDNLKDKNINLNKEHNIFESFSWTIPSKSISLKHPKNKNKYSLTQLETTLLEATSSSSLTITPIQRENEFYGILLHDSYASDQDMNHYNSAIFEAIGSQMALSIEKMRSEKQLQKALNKNEEIAKLYSQFIPEKIMTAMGYKEFSDVKLGDCKVKRLTVLFNDIIGFTSICEDLPETKVLHFFNAYYSKVSPLIKKHGGVVDKFIGDCIVAIFFEPQQAIQASIEIQELIIEDIIDPDNQEKTKNPVFTSIGLAQGNVALGPMGNEDHMEITILSDTVNIASRLCSLCKALNSNILSHGIPADDFYFIRKSLKLVHYESQKIRGKKKLTDVIGIKIQAEFMKTLDNKPKIITKELRSPHSVH